MSNPEADETDNPEKRQVKLNWLVPIDMPASLATQVAIQPSSDSQYILMLFEEKRPLIMGTEEERRRIFEDTQEITTLCVGRFLISRAKLQEWYSILGNVLKQVSEE